MADRTNFGKLKAVIDAPDLIEIQTKSYNEFLQSDREPSKRRNQGLQGVFKEVFPLESYDGRYVLDFAKYTLSPPKMDRRECLYEGQTYAAPLHVTFRLKDGDEVREEDVYMGEVPLMTEDGAFVVNGAERVVVSQLHRSPGICSEQTLHPNGQTLFSMRIIPDRGSWIELQFDTSDLLWIYMDRRRRRRKFLASTFLRALGYGEDEEIIQLFYKFEKLNLTKAYDDDDLAIYALKDDIIDIDSKTVLARKYERLTETLLDQMRDAGFKSVEVVNI
ncbi:MAG: DNA-directed RNA polymerase subunit beta, partial [Verrucomicrobia bacterium]|nr:DNA-directed RNA polymerase subunit beta [Verrucomicrobiota bacterium]